MTAHPSFITPAAIKESILDLGFELCPLHSVTSQAIQ